MRFQLLDRWTENIRMSGHTSAPDVSVYEQFNIHLKDPYRGTTRRVATRAKETATLRE